MASNQYFISNLSKIVRFRYFNLMISSCRVNQQKTNIKIKFIAPNNLSTHHSYKPVQTHKLHSHRKPACYWIVFIRTTSVQDVSSGHLIISVPRQSDPWKQILQESNYNQHFTWAAIKSENKTASALIINHIRLRSRFIDVALRNDPDRIRDGGCN